jgi:hypothetical protein
MGKKSIGDIRHEVLSRVQKELVNELVPAQLSDRDENGIEVLAVDILNSAEDGYDAMGEFFFLPGPDDAEVQFFVNLITIADDLPEANLPELCVAISAINTYVVTGAFSIDVVSKSVVFKHTYEMPTDASEEVVSDNVDLAMGVTLQMLQNYGYMIVEVNEGKRTAQSVIDLFTLME